jgi:hypothetical protein
VDFWDVDLDAATDSEPWNTDHVQQDYVFSMDFYIHQIHHNIFPVDCEYKKKKLLFQTSNFIFLFYIFCNLGPTNIITVIILTV